MARPREQAGGLAEASRLLQEGLQLLEQRQREVDRLLEDARERALLIREEAEQRAAAITAAAEEQRTQLEALVATLRAEVEELRTELTQLRAARTSPRSARRSEVELPSTSGEELSPTRGDEVSSPGERDIPTSVSETPDRQSLDGPTAVEVEAHEAPRWGRPSTTGGGQAARGGRSSRPRWLPPWLPFLLIPLVAAALVATNVNGQQSSRPNSSDGGETPADVIQPLASVQVASAEVTATPLPTATATIAALVRAIPTATLAAPTPQATATAPAPAVALPPAGARLGSPVAVPGDAGPQGPIVAAYTAYSSYTVRPGDTLNQVASQFGVSGDTIVRSSGLVDPNLLVPGQVLTIPRESGWLYRAQAGDTLDAVALRLGISADDLAQANPNLAGARLSATDLVFVPERSVAAPKR